MTRLSSLLLSMALLALACSVQAATLVPGTYQLLDHPDSALTDLPNGISYGLRLDALGGTAAERTFSVNRNGANLTLDWDGSTAILSGQVSNNATGLLWSLSYTMTTTSVAGGFEGASAGGILIAPGFATINLLNGLANSAGLEFSALADGHRCGSPTTSGENCVAGDDTVVARGWVTLNGDDTGTNDFLVQVAPVPVPAALPLLLSGILGFSVFSRKKKLS